MNARYIFLISIAFVIGCGLFFFNSSYFSFSKKDPVICFYLNNNIGEKGVVDLLYQELKNRNFDKKQIIENPANNIKGIKVNVFFDQYKFDNVSTVDQDVLNIAVGLNNSFENDEYPKIVGAYEQDKMVHLLELIQKLKVDCKEILVIYDPADSTSVKNITKLHKIFALKNIVLHECALDKKRNLATELKQVSAAVQAAILMPSDLVINESELVLEHFKIHKIPVFANHLGLIKSGALAGFCYDVQDLAYGVAQLIFEYFDSKKQEIDDDLLAELIPQLHVNMDILKNSDVHITDGLLDEAVTVSGEDL